MKPLARLFAQAKIPAGVEEQLAALAARGPVVFVMRSAGWLNLSFIRWLCRHLGLPALAATVGMGRLLRLLLGRRGGLKALEEATRARAPGLIFLRRPSVLRAKGVGAPMIGGGDPFPALVELQRAHATPIFLVPILYVWSRRPQRIKPSLIDRVLGSTEAPGAFTTSISFLRNHSRAFVRMGRPIDLREFLDGEARRHGPVEAGAGARRVARKVRGALYYHLSREARAVLGPPFKEPARVREEVMRDRALRETIAALAGETGRPADDLAQDAARTVRQIAARLSPLALEFIRPVVIWICNRLYQGIVLDQAGLAEVRQAANRGGLVLCPSHKSHMDYVLLSYVFYEQGLLPPHVAAGINLAFWPAGAILRRAGGFFIRRSFKGDRLYGAVLRAYVKRLIRDGFPQEFFIEGGRSRTGKLAFPKTGLLAMEVDAWRESSIEDLSFVPVAIDYEKLPEGKSYARELGGAEKRKESLWALLRARKVLRSRRQGRIYIQFGQPISLKALAGEAGLPDEDSARRAFVQSLAHRIAHGINRASTVTPVGLCAAALLASRDEIAVRRLTERIQLLRAIAVRDGARLSPLPSGGGGRASGSGGGPGNDDGDGADAGTAEGGGGTAEGEGGQIAEALALLSRDGLVRARGDSGGAAGVSYVVPAERRAELDFYRNNVIQHFIGYAIIAAAIDARGAAGASRPEIERDARWLSRLFKLEFIYRVGARFETIFAETFAAMEQLGLIATREGLVMAADEGGGDRGCGGAGGGGDGEGHRDPSRLTFLAQMVRPFLDAYRAAAETLADWPGGGDRRSFVRSALDRVREESAAGRALPEAVSKTTLDNAASWLLGQGAFGSAPPLPGQGPPPSGDEQAPSGEESHRWRVSPRWQSGAARALTSEIDRFRRQ